jgi:hypothetical protein
MKEHIAKLRAKLGLAADTSDEEVLRVAAEGVPEPTPEPSAPDPEPPAEGGETPEPGTVEGEPGTGAGEGNGDGQVSIDAAALAQLQADARAGREAREEQISQADEILLSSAVKCGKFPPARKEHYAKLLSADREGTIALINELEENVVPVKLRGVTPETEASQASGYPVTWLPEVAARKAALASASESRVVMGGD